MNAGCGLESHDVLMAFSACSPGNIAFLLEQDGNKPLVMMVAGPGLEPGTYGL